MRQRDVATFLAELERRLDGSAARRAQVVAEIAEHLDDLVREGRGQGLGQAAAEARAVERFGSPRALARGLRRRPRTPRVARIALALATLGLCGGFAYAQLRAAAPVVAVSLGTAQSSAANPNPVTVLGQQRLVALDPVSLRVVRRGAALLTGANIFYEFLPPEVALISPDGSQAAIVAEASLNFYDLSDLRLLGSSRLGTWPDAGPKRKGQVGGDVDLIRAGAWLGGNAVALVQHMGPPYARKVTSRTIVAVDPSTRRIVGRHPVSLKGTIVTSVRTADRLVILACADRLASILAVEADGSSALIPLGLPCFQATRVAHRSERLDARADQRRADARPGRRRDARHPPHDAQRRGRLEGPARQARTRRSLVARQADRDRRVERGDPHRPGPAPRRAGRVPESRRSIPAPAGRRSSPGRATGCSRRRTG